MQNALCKIYGLGIKISFKILSAFCIECLRTSTIRIFKTDVYKMLVMIEFFNGYNLPTLAEEKTCYKIAQLNLQ